MKCPVKWMNKWDRRGKFPWWAKWLFPTLHFCTEWDFMLIDKYCPEYESCSCHRQLK